MRITPHLFEAFLKCPTIIVTISNRGQIVKTPVVLSCASADATSGVVV